MTAAFFLAERKWMGSSDYSTSVVFWWASCTAVTLSWRLLFFSFFSVGWFFLLVSCFFLSYSGLVNREGTGTVLFLYQRCSQSRKTTCTLEENNLLFKQVFFTHAYTHTQSLTKSSGMSYVLVACESCLHSWLPRRFNIPKSSWKWLSLGKGRNKIAFIPRTQKLKHSHIFHYSF